MPKSLSHISQTLLLATVVMAPSAAAQAKPDSTRPSFVAADAAFMTGMIAHHAQAVLIAGWAPSHGASASLQTLCERIVVGQNDEIVLMQRWLRDRGQPVPDPSAPHAMMPGMDHGTAMPGMLSAEQLAKLDAARGADFDCLFLTYMIQHHHGRDHHGRSAVRVAGRHAGRGQLPDRFRRLRRPDHRDRTHAEDAPWHSGNREQPPMTFRPPLPFSSVPSQESSMARTSQVRRPPAAAFLPLVLALGR